MPDFAAISKGGWHPKGKDGGKESWRGDFKGIDQVSKWMGKGDRKIEGSRENHVARPLSTLKDPSTFAPPPKHAAYYGGTDSSSQSAQPKSTYEPRSSRSRDEHAVTQSEEGEHSEPPSVPFRADTTGLKTSHLPPPPGRKDGADGRSTQTGVMVLTPTNFESVVLKSGRPTFIDFYAPYCRYCKDLDPEYEKLAAGFQTHSSIINIAKVDADAHKNLAARYDVQGYPTLKYFDGRSSIPEDYPYGRDLESLSNFITQKTGALPDLKKAKTSPAPSTSTPAPKAKPSLPPRLPPRQNSQPGEDAPSSPATYRKAMAPPPSHQGIMNQGSVNKLAAAGISVPGLGIGSRKASLPPPTPPRTNTGSPARQSAYSPPPAEAPSRFGGAQMNELQGRFAKLSTGSKSAADAPSQGTTWAQKQAALKTAQSFQKDPSSISLSDARSAASTANNFRERHGEQVAAGWQSANKLNSKYGLSDKVSRYGGTMAATRESQPSPEPADDGPLIMRDNTVPMKKAPPPPPKKRVGLSGNADTGEGPPPVPVTSKPKPAPRSGQTVMQDLDLDLQSEWFAKQPIAFPPPCISRLPGSRGYASSSGWSSSGSRKTFTFNGIIRHNVDLSTTKIHLTWDGHAPAMTVKAQQTHIPPPRPLSAYELEQYRSQYAERIANWCEARMGTQVGNGECWTLAAEALKAVAADGADRGVEPCMASQGVVHGYAVYKWLPPKPQEPSGGIQAAGVARGDIAQFLSCHFKKKNGLGESWAGAPDHTAVITGVESNGVLRVVEANAGGVKTVQTGMYDFSELAAGEVRIFRAVGEGWIGPLDPSWL